MNNTLAFGTYVPGKSVIHKLNAQVKIILACVFSVCGLFVDTWYGLGLLWAAVIVGYILSRVSLCKALRGLTPIAFILLFTILCNMFDGWLQVSLEGFLRGVFFALRIALLVAACCLLSFTTSSHEITQSLHRLLSPLEKVHVPVADLCMVISIALRFVPTVTQEAYALRSAREARGAAFEGKGVIWMLRSWTAVISPLFVSLFKRADRLARAMDARCYAGSHIAAFSQHPVKAAEATVAVMLAAAVVAVAVLL